jgi:predicted small lipoprotein YifL
MHPGARALRVAAASLAMAMLLAACGQKGALYLPGQSQSAVVTPVASSVPMASPVPVAAPAPAAEIPAPAAAPATVTPADPDEAEAQRRNNNPPRPN